MEIGIKTCNNFQRIEDSKYPLLSLPFSLSRFQFKSWNDRFHPTTTQSERIYLSRLIVPFIDWSKRGRNIVLSPTARYSKSDFHGPKSSDRFVDCRSFREGEERFRSISTCYSRCLPPPIFANLANLSINGRKSARLIGAMMLGRFNVRLKRASFFWRGRSRVGNFRGRSKGGEGGVRALRTHAEMEIGHEVITDKFVDGIVADGPPDRR